MSGESCTPRATYRLQLRSGIGFEQVAELADYLARLGISHVYLSPCQTAALGSTHGYDIVEPRTLDETLGGERGYAAMCAALRANGLGLVLDVVPNHMSIARPSQAGNAGNAKPAWWSVLERGRASPYAAWFDVDWDARGADGKVVLAILGAPVEVLLARGEIRVSRENGALLLRAQDHLLPIDPAAPTAEIESALAGEPRAVSDLLERQHYHLAEFRTGRRALNYRRFFDIDGLIGVRVGDERVFEETHRAVLALLDEGTLQGLRVDHPDGLRDPRQYFERLRAAAPRAWIVVEKILAHDETLPRAWPVDGTTGYDFLERVGGLFVDPDGERSMTELYASFTGETATFPEIAREKKRLALARLFASDVERVVELFARMGARHAEVRGSSRSDWKSAVEEVILGLDVYRTYVRAGEPASAADARTLEQACASALRARPDLEQTIACLRSLFRGELSGEVETDALARFQQLCGPVTAKGVEDTAFYCYHRLISACEVGGDPARFGSSVAEFHAFCARIQAERPATMTSTATHDTKRGEDVRVRIDLLSWIPDEWARTVRDWSAACERHRTNGAPVRRMEYLLYQTLVGSWPITEERLLAFATKAAREAKLHTSWLEPDAAYEGALARFVRGILRDTAFVERLESFLEPLSPVARALSLSQTVLKLCAPGVPDVYQGNELWDLSLTDPDNRRSIDFGSRRAQLAELDTLARERILARPEEGLPKMWVTRTALGLRRERARSFAPGTGTYTPLRLHGPRAKDFIAFARGDDVVVVAARSMRGTQAASATTLELPPGSWRDRFARATVHEDKFDLEILSRRFPLAVLVAE